MKRPGEYVAKEWSEQKVPEIAVIGLYDTYQKCIRLEALTLTSWEKNGLEFFSKKISRILSIFSAKNRGFWGVKPGPLESPIIHLMAHQKILGGYYLKKLNIQ